MVEILITIEFLISSILKIDVVAHLHRLKSVRETHNVDRVHNLRFSNIMPSGRPISTYFLTSLNFTKKDRLCLPLIIFFGKIERRQKHRNVKT